MADMLAVPCAADLLVVTCWMCRVWSVYVAVIVIRSMCQFVGRETNYEYVSSTLS